MLLELIRFKNDTMPFSRNWSNMELCGLVIPEFGELVSQTKPRSPVGTHIYQGGHGDVTWSL